MSGGSIMRRIVIVLGIIILAMLTGCAKANDPVSNTESSVLTIERTFQTVGDPLDLSVTDSKLYIAEDQGGFSAYDLQLNSLIGRFNISSSMPIRAKRISVVPEAHRLYLTNTSGSDQIMVFDTENLGGAYYLMIGQTDALSYLRMNASTPEFPSLSGDPVYLNSDVCGLALKGSSTIKYIYSAIGDSVNGDNGNDLFTLPTSLIFKDLEREDNYIYAAADQRGLVVYQMNYAATDNILPLQYCGEADTPGEADDVVLYGSYAYIADAQGGLQVIDISDPAHPARITDGAYATDSFARSVARIDHYLLVGTYGDGVYLFDISDPASPNFMQHIAKSTTGYVNKIATANGKFYVASRDKGVLVMSVN
jgi:hypothetical protein